MDTPLLLNILAIFALLCFSAFFSGSETALTAASRARIHRLAQDGDRRAQRVDRLIENRERLIGGILLGNNLVNILASALATSVFIQMVGEGGVVYATLVMTALVLVFAEVMPKTYAIARTEKMALVVGPPIGVIVSLFGPVVAVVRQIVRMTLRVFGIDIAADQDVLSAHEEIRGTIDLHTSEGGIVKAHRDMLGSILDLDEVTVEDVMIHRKNMSMIDAADPPAKIVNRITRSPYTRLPVWDHDPENIIGVLHAKDVLRALRRAGNNIADIDVRRVMKQPWFVPETTTLREQMNAFLDRRAHVALVVDEYGALMGLVTLEDILEEIVGDIADEHDFKAEGVRELPDGWVLTDGTVTIRDLNRQFDWSLPDGEASTVAGLVIWEAETIPIVGQCFSFHGFDLEIVGRRRNQITKIKIRPAA